MLEESKVLFWRFIVHDEEVYEEKKYKKEVWWESEVKEEENRC